MSDSRFNPINYFNRYVITPTVNFAKNITLAFRNNPWLESITNSINNNIQPIFDITTPHLRATIVASLATTYLYGFEEGIGNALYVALSTTFCRDIILRKPPLLTITSPSLVESNDLLAISLAVNLCFVLDITNHLSNTPSLSTNHLMLQQHIIMYIANLLALLSAGVYKGNNRITLFQLPVLSRTFIAEDPAETHTIPQPS